MKIYISDNGKLSQGMRDILLGIDCTPVVADVQDSWPREKRIGRMIRTLIDCDGILMLSDWQQDEAADIEHTIAKKLRKALLYEEPVRGLWSMVNIVEAAVQKVLDISFASIANRKRTRLLCIAREIFCHHLCAMGASKAEIGQVLRRSVNTVEYYLAQYHAERKYNRDFREAAEAVEALLNAEKPYDDGRQ